MEAIIPTINWIVGVYIDRAEVRVPLEALRKPIIRAMCEGYHGGDNIAYEFYKSFFIQTGRRSYP
jgi:hypothetical protein